jgi:hypothetical protein
VFDDTTGNIYIGPTIDGKKQGQGRFYDAEKNSVYEGWFENDKK